MVTKGGLVSWDAGGQVPGVPEAMWRDAQSTGLFPRPSEAPLRAKTQSLQAREALYPQPQCSWWHRLPRPPGGTSGVVSSQFWAAETTACSHPWFPPGSHRGQEMQAQRG